MKGFKKATVEQARSNIKNYRPKYEALLKEKENNPDSFSANKQRQLNFYRGELVALGQRFELCSDESGTLRSSGIFSGLDGFDWEIRKAEIYSHGMNLIAADAFSEFKKGGGELANTFRKTRTNPHSYTAIDHMALLAGVSQSKDSNEQKRIIDGSLSQLIEICPEHICRQSFRIPSGCQICVLAITRSNSGLFVRVFQRRPVTGIIFI